MVALAAPVSASATTETSSPLRRYPIPSIHKLQCERGICKIEVAVSSQPREGPREGCWLAAIDWLSQC